MAKARQYASVLAGHLATYQFVGQAQGRERGQRARRCQSTRADKVDLAVVRADVGDFTQARTVALMGTGV